MSEGNRERSCTMSSELVKVRSRVPPLLCMGKLNKLNKIMAKDKVARSFGSRWGTSE